MTSESLPILTIKKKVDDRIKNLVDRVAAEKHRGIVILVGDRGRDQILNLHTMVSRAQHNSKISVLWCMKNEPEFGSTGKKGFQRKSRHEMKAGMTTESSKEAFQVWLQQTQIRFCQYKESHKVLGNTFGMAVLQDFESITPNILARTIETVAGGGLIILMIRSMSALKQLHTLVMDVHARYRTEAFTDVVPRFNERFLLSFGDCEMVLCIDDDFNVLPFTSNMKTSAIEGGGLLKSAVKQENRELALQGQLQHEADLINLKDKLKSVSEVSPLVNLCNTMDQAKSVLSLMKHIMQKNLDTTCIVTASRGRGKSAALGIAAAGAISQGYSNIFVTAPAPDNLQTFFEFTVKTLVELGYNERQELSIMQSTNPDFSKCVIRINIFKNHRQTIQFIAATDAVRMQQAELLIIDEAAAIPLTVVKKMLGPYLIFLSSTISGYEGTGRSLSMKLVADMRKSSGMAGERSLLEISLSDPIRYGPNDPVEAWLVKLLCLEATEASVINKSSPHPSQCELYYVDRDALFSYHPASEKLLHEIMSLLVAAHYKNQPNDLQLMSDAPGHHIFILCDNKRNEDRESLPDIFCVIHACEEGNISAEALQNNINKGYRPNGDLVPYTFAQHYLEKGFAKLVGLRIIRIATNPEFQSSGYGSRALQLLKQYYSGAIAAIPQGNEDAIDLNVGFENNTKDSKDIVKKVPSLLTPIHVRPYELIDYISVSFGVTKELYNFWKRNEFELLYMRQVANDLTGEHSCIMVLPFGFDIKVFKREFTHRFVSLCSMSFRNLSVDLALSLLLSFDVTQPHLLEKAITVDPNTKEVSVDGVTQLGFQYLQNFFTTSDIRRLELSISGFVDISVVLDLIPLLAKLYFQQMLFRTPENSEGVILTHAQAAVLLGVGLQRKSIDELCSSSVFEGIPPTQLRSFFQKAVSRLAEHLSNLRKLRQAQIAEEVEKGLAHEQLHNKEVSGDSEDKGDVNDKQAQRLLGNKAIRDGEFFATTGEEISEQYDAQGNVTGLSVKRKVKPVINTDSTLTRDVHMKKMGEKTTFKNKFKKGNMLKKRK